MKFDFMKDRDGIINFMIVTSCHKVVNELAEENKKKKSNGIYDIVFTVDGIEMDLKWFMKRWQENVNRFVEEAAKELVNDKLNELLNSIDELREEVDTTISKAIKDKLENMEKKNEDTN